MEEGHCPALDLSQNLGLASTNSMSKSSSIYGSGGNNRGSTSRSSTSNPRILPGWGNSFLPRMSPRDVMRKGGYMIKDTMSLTKAQFSALLTRVNYLTPRDETPMEEQEKTTTVSAAIDLNRKRSELSAQYDAVVTSTSALDAAVQESVEEKMQHPYEFVDPSAMDVDEDEGLSRVDYINEQIALRKKELDPQEVDNLRKIFARFDRGDRDSIVIDKFSIDMSVRKMNCLKPGCWLNDEIINFYMNMLQARNNAKVNTIHTIYTI